MKIFAGRPHFYCGIASLLTVLPLLARGAVIGGGRVSGGRMGGGWWGGWGSMGTGKDEGEDGDKGDGEGGLSEEGRVGEGGGEKRGFEWGQGQEVVGGIGEGVLAWAGVSVQVASASLVKSNQIRSSKDVIGQVVEFEAEEIKALEGGNARPQASENRMGNGSDNGDVNEGVTEGTQQEEERSWWRWDAGKGELVQREGPEGLADGQETLLWLPEIVYDDLELMDLRYFQVGEIFSRACAARPLPAPPSLAVRGDQRPASDLLPPLPTLARHPFHPTPSPQGLHCAAPACPSFSHCRTGRRQAGRVLACTGNDPLLSDPLSGNNGGASSQTASTDASGTSSVGASGSDSMATVGSASAAGLGSASAAGLGSASVDASPLVDPSPVLTSPPPNHVKDNATYDVAVAEPFAAQVFLLENVFINDRGMVFDAMYHYRHGLLCRSCPLDFGLYTGNETKVHVYSELLSLANWNGGNFYHSLLEVMPSLLYLRPFLEAKPGIPIPVKIDQDKHARLFSLININASTLNFQTVRKDHLFFARRLLLPSIAQCGRPSAALVRHLRNHYLLPPSAPRIKSRHELAQFSSYATATTVPVTAAATDVAAAGNAGTDATAAAASDGAGLAAGGGVLATPDWCVVVGQRDTTRRIVGRTHILEELQAFFPKERITVFRGDLPLPEAKQLFNRARLFITPHGALMANMVFMPPGGFVLEARPEDFDNNLYDYLAYVCDLHYYLVKGVGGKDTDIRVDMEEMVGVVDEISKKLIAQNL
ncbi:unnamed protein product [Closterium sp. Naga37s-1]|nr:unnamed protein product [Closterium sp. Naga37s-1]